MIAIGLGCRRGAASDEVVALVREALALLPPPSSRGEQAEPGTGFAGRDIRSGRARSVPGPRSGDLGTTRAGGLFTLADKRGEPGLVEAARLFGLPLTFLDRAVLALAAGEARSCSRRVEEMFGLPGIAETAALAGAGQGAVLLVPRLTSATVTCAIAGPSVTS